MNYLTFFLQSVSHAHAFGCRLFKDRSRAHKGYFVRKERISKKQTWFHNASVIPIFSFRLANLSFSFFFFSFKMTKDYLSPRYKH